MTTKVVAKYWEILSNDRVRCRLCPNNCVLRPGQMGPCRTRINQDGVLYSVAYANPVAVHVDPIEKKPLAHFLPGSLAFSISTAGCNLACKNCQNWEISQASPLELPYEYLPPEKVVQQAIDNECKSIAYTYTDPTAFYEYTLDTAKIAKARGIKNVIVSAGYINPEPLEELAPYLDGANIDLKSFDDRIYRRLNSGRLQPVLDTLKILKKHGVWLEITNLIIPGYTDDMDMIRQMCHWLVNNGFAENPLHFSRFYPSYRLPDVPPTPVSTLEKAIEIALEEGIQYPLIGNVLGHKYESTYCTKCGKKVIGRSGFNVTEINITDGKCNFCGHPIPGVWK